MGMEPQHDRWQPLGNQGLLSRLDHPHGDVGLALQQVVHGVGQDQLDHEARVAPTQGRQDRRQVLDADDLAGANPDAAAHLAGVAACGPHQRRCGGGQGFGIGCQGQRHLGRDQATLRAQEQVCADRLLQRVDMAGDRRLRQPEPTRSTRQ